MSVRAPEESARVIVRISTDGAIEELVAGDRPMPSNDGSQFAFIDAGGGLSIADIAGENVQSVHPGKATTLLFDFRWGPSDRLAYVTASFGQTGVNYTLWLFQNGNAEKLIEGPDEIGAVRWFPDGTSLLLAAKAIDESATPVGELQILSLADGETRTVFSRIRHPVITMQPEISPDGSTIVFNESTMTEVAADGGFVNANRPSLVSIDGEFRPLIAEPDYLSFLGPQSLVWLPDGNEVVFVCKKAAFAERFCVASRDGEIREVQLDPLYDIGVIYVSLPLGRQFSLSNDGSSLAWLATSASGETQLQMTPLAPERIAPTTIYDATPPTTRNLNLGRVEQVQWPSSDGLEISGILIHPVVETERMQYPLVVDVHGGPQPGVTPFAANLLVAGPIEWHLWANLGYAVFVPDYRGSEVYGYAKWAEAREDQSFSDRDFDDVMSGVDALIERGIADPDRMMLIGHSAGAAVANWALTHTDRFQAIISKEGLGFDVQTTYEIARDLDINADLRRFYDWWFKGTPEEVPENYAARSAMTYIDNVVTPVLFFYGAESSLAFVPTPRTFFEALISRGVDAEFVVYPGEGHGFVKPETQRDVLLRSVELARKHIGMP